MKIGPSATARTVVVCAGSMRNHGRGIQAGNGRTHSDDATQPATGLDGWRVGALAVEEHFTHQVVDRGVLIGQDDFFALFQVRFEFVLFHLE